MVLLDGNSLTRKSFSEIVDDFSPVDLSLDAKSKIQKSRAVVEKAIQEKDLVYSINTGFGYLSKVTVPPDKLEALQKNLIRSHAVGVGGLHSEKESRAILLLRANVLAKGFSGVRLELVEFLVSLLNHKIHPVIPLKGSVGASGDLAPLAHLASVVLGEGEVFFEGKKIPSLKALQKVGLAPITLAPKEGLSLINGTQQMTAMGLLLLERATQAVNLADLIAATSLEGVLGTEKAFMSWVHETRPYPGQVQTAQFIQKWVSGSEVMKSHEKCDRVQDPYSFRCVPQVHGAIRDLLQFVEKTLMVEMNAATDNPLVNSETGEIVSQGNFHGQPVAFALDILAMALSELSNISERRIAKLIDPQFSTLPAFLVKNEGLNSGFMMPHVTAASLVSENKLLSHPASTDSIPTSNEKEDHVSMGPLAARKAKTVLENTSYVLAIEALAACQAIELRRPLTAGSGPEFLFQAVRQHVSFVEEDRYFHEDIQKIFQLFQTGELFEQAKRGGLWH